MRVGAGGEGGDFLVADVQPVDPAMAAERVGEAVEAVADDAVDPSHAGRGEGLDHLVGNGCGHRIRSYSLFHESTPHAPRRGGRKRIGAADGFPRHPQTDRLA